MIENVEKLISRHGYNKIFLVTEEIEYLNAFKKHFGKNVFLQIQLEWVTKIYLQYIQEKITDIN